MREYLEMSVTLTRKPEWVCLLIGVEVNFDGLLDGVAHAYTDQWMSFIGCRGGCGWPTCQMLSMIREEGRQIYDCKPRGLLIILNPCGRIEGVVLI